MRETPSVQVIFDRQDQLEQIEAGLLPGEEIEAVFDVKGSGTGFVGITSKRIIFQTIPVADAVCNRSSSA